MKQQLLEARVISFVEMVVSGRRIEDDRVEAKSVWPTDHRRAARQIAGLANASGGEPILWIVGLDEDAHRVVAPGAEDPSTWWGQVSRWFAEVSPDPGILTVPTPHGVVVAIQFETIRCPYLVTTEGKGGVDREVPWRTANTTRSAHRSEILRALVAEAQVPEIEVISAWARFEHLEPQHYRGAYDHPKLEHPDVPHIRVSCVVEAYVECLEATRLPQHRWSVALTTGEERLEIPMHIQGPQAVVGQSNLGFAKTAPTGSITYVPNSGLHVNGSDSLRMQAVRENIPDPDGRLAARLRLARRVDLIGRFPIASSTRQASMDAALNRRRRTPMEERVGGNQGRVDRRVGEFTYGRATPWEYHEAPSEPLETAE